MRPPDRVIYVLGEFREVLINTFKLDVIGPSLLRLSDLVEQADVLDELARNPEVGHDLTVVWLCSEAGDSLVEFIESVQTLREKTNRVVVLSHDLNCEGNLAIRWIRAGARDYLDTGYRPDILLHHMLSAIAGISPYPDRMELPKVISPRDVFVVTAFSHPLATKDFHHGIVPACQHAFSFDGCPARGDLLFDTGFLLPGLQKMIDDAKIVIANLSGYGETTNPNVNIEVGYMLRKRNKLILLRRHGEKPDANLAGLRFVEYFSSADLAIHLFHRFGCAPRAAGRPQ